MAKEMRQEDEQAIEDCWCRWKEEW